MLITRHSKATGRNTKPIGIVKKKSGFDYFYCEWGYFLAILVIETFFIFADQSVSPSQQKEAT